MNFCKLLLPALLLAALPAHAHVVLDTPQAPADSYYKAVLNVPHGCKDSPTVRLRVRIPDGVTGARPQPKHGWKVEIKNVKLGTPLDDGHGGKITERVGEIAWSGGPLEAAHFDEFRFVMKLPNKPNSTLYFPVVQECVQGAHHWIEVPAGKQSKELKEPAPALRLTPKP